MSEAKSIFDGCKYLYAEQLKGKRVTLTIKSVTQCELVGDGGRKSMGFEIAFAETPKLFAFSGATVRRQLAGILGEDIAAYAGKKVVLYPAESKRSVSGWAIRVAAP